MAGGSVVRRQALLGLATDGVFGAATTERVRGFQRENGLTADGLVGAATWGALEKVGARQG